MARICILANRVSVPAVHPGGLEVALRALLKEHHCVWMGWSGKAVDGPADVEVRYSSAYGTDYIVTDPMSLLQV